MDLPVVQPVCVIDQDLALIQNFGDDAHMAVRVLFASLEYQHGTRLRLLAASESAGSTLPQRARIAPYLDTRNHPRVGSSLKRLERRDDCWPEPVVRSHCGRPPF